MSSLHPNFPPPPYPPGQHVIPPPRPSSPTTTGFRLNHVMIRVKDPEASLRFYNDCLGMHTVFIFNAGPWTIYFLGPRDVGMQNLGTSRGFLELFHIPADEDREYMNGNDYAKPGIGFGHIGFTVPDVDAALKRVQEFGSKVIKPLNEASVKQMGVPDMMRDGEVAEGSRHAFRQIAFVEDPDGYWVELVPQVFEPPGST